MSTPKKEKAYTSRTTGASRTRKSKPYSGVRNYRQPYNIGEGMAPGHDARLIQRDTLTGLITASLSDKLLFTPSRDPHGHDISAHGTGDREKFSRKQWRRMMLPWRKPSGDS